ncbi:inositol monophosphatase [Acidimicrobium ferrooxidans DSM 10331]|uniref:inositol-phosphate phosphatase n=1 Tax=Acidimicrobium ferrooxidans (strain DSM 10331 / JCM 15462 / NBRC 103882 / ICP) TaxID=525909 RepID=C7LXW3_ACIFD|nr:inositol monophosphatase family protein [Acidimicrobium ferrooxidans]ACU53571.1 inositol monophosphatase [Acidimicrobium ferrooxidans DSM 10331]
MPEAAGGVDQLLTLARETAEACLASVEATSTDWSSTGDRRGQHRGDVVADQAALELLDRPWLNVVSEESGVLDRGAALTAIVDPIDGSTNASRGLFPWASSVAIADDKGPLVGVVSLCRGGGTYWAVRGAGARRDRRPVSSSAASSVRGKLVACNGTPRAWLGWGQLRAFGSAASELAFVAEGSIDALVDFSEGLAIWDIAAGVLIAREAGAAVVRANGNEVDLSPTAPRQRIVAGASTSLATELVAALAGVGLERR